jgi:exodeoxyribonuclease V alpha subunit
MKEEFEGTVESIIFYSADSGYTVSRLSLPDREDVVIVGYLPPLTPGETLKVQGKWEINPRFGKQLKVDSITPVWPSSVKGVEKFLSSGLIKGIGPELAARIVRRFGARTLTILDESPNRIAEVEGIGPVKIREIKRSWTEHRRISDLIIFLQGHGVSTNLATKIYRQYGDRSFHVLKTNPYQACYDIWGVGFKTADQMALKLGISPGSIERVKAYLLYLLEKDNEKGHVFSIESDLQAECLKELEVEVSKVEKALGDLRTGKKVVVEDLAKSRAVYLPPFYSAQEYVVKSIHSLSKFPFMKPEFDLPGAVASAEKDLGISFSETQKKAVAESFLKKILVITGGPGTGKTTIVRAVVDIFRRWGRRVLLAAPTGRAAKRLAEATGKEAKTIHRTLEYNPKTGAFKRCETHPLDGDALIIDEFSMVDLQLMFHLLKAVPPAMRLILVGDKDQLPSVGPGNLLRDIIESGRVDVVRLDQIFRQEKDSLIVVNAHRVNEGKSLVFPPKGERDADFYFMYQEDETKAFSTLVNLCTRHVPNKLKIHPLSPRIQVISPMYRGLVGVDHLNTELQKRLNPEQESLNFGNRIIRVHDKVMQIRNNYEKDVYNGDIGRVALIDRRTYTVAVDFDGRLVTYQKENMNELVLAYAISVHKSQGSEYDAVILPLMTQHFIMLQRNLFYTALTRAKRMSVIVGTYKALHIAVKNNKPVQRNCRLKEKLMEIGEEPVPE